MHRCTYTQTYSTWPYISRHTHTHSTKMPQSTETVNVVGELNKALSLFCSMNIINRVQNPYRSLYIEHIRTKARIKMENPFTQNTLEPKLEQKGKTHYIQVCSLSKTCVQMKLHRLHTQILFIKHIQITSAHISTSRACTVLCGMCHQTGSSKIYRYLYIERWFCCRFLQKRKASYTLEQNTVAGHFNISISCICHYEYSVFRFSASFFFKDYTN